MHSTPNVHPPQDVQTDPGDLPGGLAGIIAARESKLAGLRAAGLDPYPTRTERTHTTIEAVAAFEALEAGATAANAVKTASVTNATSEVDDPIDLSHSQASPTLAPTPSDGPSVIAAAVEGPHDILVAGRLVGAVRLMGGSAFVHLQDGYGQLQLHLKRNRMGQEAFDQFKALFDPGDFVCAKGSMFRTKMGEATLAVDTVTILAKSLLPLPEKWHGLQDQETRFRQRYLDLISNADSRARFVKRTQVVSAMRRFLDERGFLEVETPVLQPIYGGGAAQPFTTHYNALEQTMYLRIADELYLKRMLVGGFERVYEIAKDFRNEGIDRTHLPEFTQMECYWAYADYQDMMRLTEEMVAFVALTVNGSHAVEIDGQAIDLSPPWRRLPVCRAILEATGIDIEAFPDLAGLRMAMQERKLAADPHPTWAKSVDELLSEYVEPNLLQPTFLIDYPTELSPLAKSKPGDSRYVERFEPFVAGFELGNAFTELNDPLDQRARFEAMGRQRDAGDAEAQPLDEDFLEAMMHGMPPAGGLGIGVDRLVMLITGQANIREVVLFPQLRSAR